MLLINKLSCTKIYYQKCFDLKVMLDFANFNAHLGVGMYSKKSWSILQK